MSINSVSISGNLTKDPELRKTQSDKSVASFTLAVNENKDTVHFIDCVAWERLAEIICEYSRKGQTLSVSGKLSKRSYENKQGVTVYVTEVIAYQVQLPPKGDSAPAQQAPQTNSTPEPIDELEDEIPF